MSRSRRGSAQPTWRRVLGLAFVALIVGSLSGLADVRSTAAGTPDHREQLRFMWAMAGQESGWDYYARNASSGAFGKYQIMPFNWPAWAEEYLGDRYADQTPYNQEKVAYGKLRDLYRWLGTWKRVAYWWLTGRSDRDEKQWSAYARGYVRNIMQLRKRAPSGGAAMPPRTSSRAERGDWRRAGQAQRLRLTLAGRPWPSRGHIRDGAVLKVSATRRTPGGQRWIRVVTIDGRRGWLRQLATVPAQKPARAARWADVTDHGQQLRRHDRSGARPRPR